MEYKRITSIDDLNKAIKEKHHNFTLLLAGGLLQSKKRISFSDKTKSAYKITNHFDGTKQTLTPEEIFDESLTNIGVGITNGAFFCEINN